MEKEKGCISWEESVHAYDSRVAVEGILRLPEGLNDMAAIADTAGTAEVEEIKTAEGRAAISGRLRFTVLYANVMGALESFESESRFTHTVEDPRIKAGMDAAAHIKVRKISVRVQDGRTAVLRSEISADVLAAHNRKAEVLIKSEGELLREKTEVPVCAGIRTARIVMERSVRIPQTMPRPERILLSRAAAVLKRAEPDGCDLAVEGEVYAETVYLSEDKNAPLERMTNVLPFGDIIRDAGAERVCAWAEAEKISAYQDPDDADSILLRITLAVTAAGQNIAEIETVKDMYSPKFMLETETQDIACALRGFAGHEKRQIKIGLQVDENDPEPRRILYSAGRTEKVTCVREEGRSEAVCEAVVTLAAATEAGTRGINVPVSFGLPCSEHAQSADVTVESVEVTGAGRSLEASITVDFCEETETCRTVKAVCDVKEKESIKRESGIVVYYAGGGETLWDIAKKLRVKSDVLGEDMRAEDVVPAGTRLIMLK